MRWPKTNCLETINSKKEHWCMVVQSAESTFLEFFFLAVFYRLMGCMDKVFAIETVGSGSIPSRVKPNTIKIVIHSFPAWRSALKRVNVKPLP